MPSETVQIPTLSGMLHISLTTVMLSLHVKSSSCSIISSESDGGSRMELGTRHDLLHESYGNMLLQGQIPKTSLASEFVFWEKEGVHKRKKSDNTLGSHVTEEKAKESINIL